MTFLCAIYSLKWLPEPTTEGVPVLMLLLETGMAAPSSRSTWSCSSSSGSWCWCDVLHDRPLGRAPREYAHQVFLYTLFGSVFMLLGFLALYFRASPHTFDILQLHLIGPKLPSSVQDSSLGMGLWVLPSRSDVALPHLAARRHTRPRRRQRPAGAILLKMGTYGSCASRSRSCRTRRTYARSFGLSR